MNKYLEDLQAAIPEDAKRPTEEHIRTMDEIDATIGGTREQLKRLLKELESTYGLFVGETLWYRVNAQYPSVQFVNEGGYVDPEGFLQEHLLRVQLAREVLKGQQGIQMEDGGLKDFKRANKKVIAGRRIWDLSRMRIVCDSLLRLNSAVTFGHGVFAGEFGYLGYDNIYGGTKTGYETPFRGINKNWTGRDLGQESSIAQAIVTEIQYVTQRVRAILDLNHPFDIAKTADYPSEDHRVWVHDLFLKATILDLQNFGKEPSLEFVFFEEGARMSTLRDGKVIERLDMAHQKTK